VHGHRQDGPDHGPKTSKAADFEIDRRGKRPVALNAGRTGDDLRLDRRATPKLGVSDVSAYLTDGEERKG